MSRLRLRSCVRAATGVWMPAVVLAVAVTLVLLSSPSYRYADYPISSSSTTSSTTTNGSTTTSTSTTTLVGTGVGTGTGSLPGTGVASGTGVAAGSSGQAAPAGNPPSGLAFTGADVELTMGVAAVALGVGGMLVLVSRKRRPPVAP